MRTGVRSALRRLAAATAAAAGRFQEETSGGGEAGECARSFEHLAGLGLEELREVAELSLARCVVGTGAEGDAAAMIRAPVWAALLPCLLRRNNNSLPA